jgi:hypothetical protein
VKLLKLTNYLVLMIGPNYIGNQLGIISSMRME